MLSYQHEYHAGNFADVHKHLCLRVLFESLLKKDKPFCFIDCHAGSGRYDLQSPEARKTGESATGIANIWGQEEFSGTTAAYLDAVTSLNPDGILHHYPGSPELARQWMRPQDAAILFELHPQAQQALRRHFGYDRRFSLHARDCYEGLPALVPPAIKRGLVLLDPSYEIKEEYQQVVELVARAQRRWANAIYALWYPLLPAARHRDLLRGLKQSGTGNILVSEMAISAPQDTGGMYGSGLAIVNPPWQADDAMEALLPGVCTLLGGNGARASQQWLVKKS